MAFRANEDIAKRSMTGSYMYILIWISIIIPHKFYETSPKICLWFTLALILFSAARGGLIINFKRIYDKSPKVWKMVSYPIIWLVGLVWGIFCAMTLYIPELNYMSFPLVVATAGLTAGGSSTLVPSRPLALGLITTLLAPGGFTLLFSDTHNISVGILFGLFWIGMYAITKNQHREYWQGLKDSFLIKEYAAKLEHLNTLDGLTGLKNRAFFDQMIQQEMKRALRFQTHLSLLFIDIDYFKKINDIYGHPMGDECLRRLSSLLKEIIARDTDTVARYGGEEFAIILPNTTREQALIMSEKIRNEVEGMRIAHDDIHIRLTISIGVASTLPELNMSEERFIDQADKNLYKAKQNGRNQVMG